jgi:hypothetical protein
VAQSQRSRIMRQYSLLSCHLSLCEGVQAGRAAPSAKHGEAHEDMMPNIGLIGAVMSKPRLVAARKG